MDSFSNTEQAYSVNATPDSGEISLIGRHILSQFPDMASKKHKVFRIGNKYFVINTFLKT